MNTKQLIKSLKAAEVLLAPLMSGDWRDVAHRVNNARQIIAGCIVELELDNFPGQEEERREREGEGPI